MNKILIVLLVLIIASCGGEQIIDKEVNSSKDTLVVEIDSFALVNAKVNQHPNSTAYLFERAKFYLRHAQVDEAQVDLETILRIDSSMLDVRQKYADILLAKLDLKNGLYHYQYILDRDSTNVSAFIGLGKLFALLDNTGRAMINFNKALQIDPYIAEPYFMKGMIYRADFNRNGKQEMWDLAVSSFQTAVEQDPDYYSAYVQMGVMYDAIGDERALEYYNSALDVFPESLEALYNKALYFQRRDQAEEANLLYREALSVDSTWSELYYNQGYIKLIIQEDMDSAIYYFEKAVYWEPSFAAAYNNMGLAYEKKDDIVSAKKYYQKAIEINPDFQLAKDNLNALQK